VVSVVRFARQFDVPSSYWRLAPNIARENVTDLRKSLVLAFLDLTPYSLVFHDVSKVSHAFISMD